MKRAFLTIASLLLASTAALPQASVRARTIQDPVAVYNNWSAYDELSDIWSGATRRGGI